MATKIISSHIRIRSHSVNKANKAAIRQINNKSIYAGTNQCNSISCPNHFTPTWVISLLLPV